MKAEQLAVITMYRDVLDGLNLRIASGGLKDGLAEQLTKIYNSSSEIVDKLEKAYESEIPVIPLAVIEVKTSSLKSKVTELTEQREHYVREGEWIIVNSIKGQIAKYHNEIKIYESLMQDAILK